MKQRKEATAWKPTVLFPPCLGVSGPACSLKGCKQLVRQWDQECPLSLHTQKTFLLFCTQADLSLWRSLCRGPGQASRAAFSASQGKRKGEQQKRGWFSWIILVGAGWGIRWDGGSSITSPTQEHWFLATGTVAEG